MVCGWSLSVFYDEIEINKEVVKYMVKSFEVEIIIFVLRCDDVDKEEVKSYNINFVEVGEKIGFVEVDWFGWLLKELLMDVVVGYDIEFGCFVLIIKEF